MVISLAMTVLFYVTGVYEYVHEKKRILSIYFKSWENMEKAEQKCNESYIYFKFLCRVLVNFILFLNVQPFLAF